MLRPDGFFQLDQTLRESGEAQRLTLDQETGQLPSSVCKPDELQDKKNTRSA